MRQCVSLFAVLILGGLSQAAFASTTGLVDWCTNLNGDISVCNGASASSGSVNTAGFDETLSGSGTNNLGSIAFTLTGAGYASVWMDYDLDFQTMGSFNDFGTVVGAQPAGVSFEMDDPNTSNIFNDFSSSSLTNTNNVGTPSGPPSQCCDVSWALAFQSTEAGTVTFTVSSTKPSSGFYLQQTSDTVGDSIYLTESFTPAVTGVPEPGSLGLLGTLLGGLALARLRKPRIKSI